MLFSLKLTIILLHKPGNIFLDSYDHVKIGDFGKNLLMRIKTTFKATDKRLNLTSPFSHSNQVWPPAT